MKKNKAAKVVLALAMCAIFSLGFAMMSDRAAAEGGNVILVDSTSSGSTIEVTPVPTLMSTPSAVPTPTATPDLSKLKINTQKVVIMAKKKYTLSVTGATAPVLWKSSDETVATVTDGVVKGLKKGVVDITATVSGATLKCRVTVVAKMTKKDFSKFTSENFVGYCQRKRYDQGNGYAWVGQWKGGSKKKTTYRGIKIGMKKSKVKNAYGNFTAKKCSSKDPFTKMKGLKKNKVKTYGEMKYGKYRIRFYFNKSNKVVAIIFSCNFSKITQSSLSKYM